MVDVAGAKIRRLAKVDQITFGWNTLLQVVTLGYFILLEAYREGVEWVLSPEATNSTVKSLESTSVELNMGRNLVSLMISEIIYMYTLGEVFNVVLPLVVYKPILRTVFYWRLGTDSFRRFLQGLLPKSHDLKVLTAREAEEAQALVPLMLWMEYTYLVVFPAMAFMTFLLASDSASEVFKWLLIFALVFYAWQRYVMLWGYGKTTYDSAQSFIAFTRVWGLVLAMLPTASVWWAWRLGLIPNHLVALMMVLVFSLVTTIYAIGLLTIEWFLQPATQAGVSAATRNRADNAALVPPVKPPSYEKVMDQRGYTWWNVNPVYVLKARYCPNIPEHEVHDEVKCWPSKHTRCGFFQLGKEFRHVPRARWVWELASGYKKARAGSAAVIAWDPRQRAGSRWRRKSTVPVSAARSESTTSNCRDGAAAVTVESTTEELHGRDSVDSCFGDDKVMMEHIAIVEQVAILEDAVIGRIDDDEDDIQEGQEALRRSSTGFCPTPGCVRPGDHEGECQDGNMNALM